MGRFRQKRGRWSISNSAMVDSETALASLSMASNLDELAVAAAAVGT